MTKETWGCKEVSLPDFSIPLLISVKGYWREVMSAATTLIFLPNVQSSYIADNAGTRLTKKKNKLTHEIKKVQA